MNKNEKKLLSKGESLYFESEDGDYKVSAETISVEIFEKMKESVDSKKIVLEEKMEKRKDSKEEVLVKKELEGKDGEVSKEKIPNEVPKKKVLKEKISDEVETVIDEISKEDLKDPEEVPEEAKETSEEIEEVSEEIEEVSEEIEEVEELPDEAPEEELIPEKEFEEDPVKKVRVPKEPDPCPGVSSKEHWPILRNRFFIVLAVLFLLAILFSAFYVGNNRGAASFAPKEAISEEIIAARHELPLTVAYFTGSNKSWKTVDRWSFSLSNDSPVVWAYVRGGVLYYNEECRVKIDFSGENLGNLKNANSSLGPVTLSEDGITWTVDNTGEEIHFLSGLQTDLAKEVGNFTAGGAKKPTFSEVNFETVEVASTKIVVLPIYSADSVVYYNNGRGWKALPVSEWDGDVSKFEFWNFGYGSSSLRYWDSEMKEIVSPSSSDSGNYFWMKDKDGKSQKAKWNGSSIEAL